MPSYFERVPFQPLDSAHRQTVFLRSLSKDHFAELQNLARDAKAEHVHPDAFRDFATGNRHQLIWALWQEHHARRKGEKTGGGLGSALNWLGSKVTHPIKGLWNVARNAKHLFTHSTTVSGHTRVVAMAIQETYKKDESERKETLGPYTRLKEYSTDWIDVWENPETNQLLCTVRGSRDAVDFAVDDVGIMAGTGPRNLVGKQLQDIFEKFPEHHKERAGHSLGSALIDTALQKNESLDPERIDYFNPGTSPLPWAHDAVNSFSSDERAHYYMNALDPVSMGQMAEKPVNLVLNKPQSWANPAANHTLDQWVFQQKI